MSSVRSHAFTLIELLVVVAIIAVIAAILFPVFASAREKARQISCTSNLRQLGLAFAQYGNDYDETLPLGTLSGLGGNGWAGQLYPYVKSAGAFACPDDSTTPKFNTVGSTTYVLQPVSYAYNQDIGITSESPQSIGGEISLLNAPSKTVLLYEVTAALNPGAAIQNYNVTDLSTINETGSSLGSGKKIYSPIGAGLAADNVLSELQQATGYTGGILREPWFQASVFTGQYGRHSRGSNYLACDGHVKWLMGDAVSTGYYWHSPVPGASTTPTSNEGGLPALTTAAGTESSEGWTLTFSPI